MGTFNLLEKVTPAVKLAVSGVALLIENALAHTTLDALYMPRFIQDFHQVTFHYRLFAATTHKGGHSGPIPK